MARNGDPNPVKGPLGMRCAAVEARGMALIGAIGMLFLFAVLGTAYVRSMALELDGARSRVDRVRADFLAQGGVEAAIGEIGAALVRRETPQASYTFSLNVYRYEGGALASHPQQVRVTVSDEAARVNVNHAPAALLRALGFDADSVNRFRSTLPSGSGRSSDFRHWLYSVDDLRTRNLVRADVFAALDKGALTTYTVGDPANPSSYINLNTVPPATLAAIFAIGQDEALELAGKRPFRSWRDTVEKTGREPSSFNVKPGQYASRQQPKELAFSSRCFRIRADVSYVRSDTSGSGDAPVVVWSGPSAAVEAVVYFDRDGTHSIRYWDDDPEGSAAVSPEAEPSSPAEIAPAGAEAAGGTEASNDRSQDEAQAVAP